MRRLLSLGLLILLLEFVLNAQINNVSFNRITTEDGLSQNWVNNMIQDHYGFMWFGTSNGLNKYDGYRFEVYQNNSKDSNSLARNHVICLYEDKEKNLWIGTKCGLQKYNRDKNNFKTYLNKFSCLNGRNSNNINSLLEDKNGNFWVGSECGLYLLDRKTETFTCFCDIYIPGARSFQNEIIYTIFEDKSGQKWIGCSGGLFSLDETQKEPIKRINVSLNDVRCIYEDNEGYFWLGSSFSGFEKIDKNSGKSLNVYNNLNNKLKNYCIHSICEYKPNILLLGTDDGLTFLNKSTGDLKTYRNVKSDYKSISSNIIQNIYTDKGGIVWIGTPTGLNKFDSNKKKFSFYKNEPGNNNSLSDQLLHGCIRDKKGNIWVAFLGGGLQKIDAKTGNFTTYKYDPNNPNSPLTDKLRCLYEDQNGTIWLGCDGEGIIAFDPQREVFMNYGKSTSLYNNYINTFFQDRDGILWIGTFGGGIFQSTEKLVKGKKPNFNSYYPSTNNKNSLSGIAVFAIFQDKAGEIWIGTNNGLSRVIKKKNDKNEEQVEFINYQTKPQTTNNINDNAIYAIFEDSNGILWFGTEGGGANQFDKKTGTFKSYTTSEGLPDNTVVGILEDNHKNIWWATKKGLSKYTPGKKPVFINYVDKESAQANEYMTNACFANENGILYFGAADRLNYFNPDSIYLSHYEPLVVITDFKLADKSVVAGEEYNGRIILEKPIVDTPSIHLKYSENIFSIEFAVLNYSAPNKNKYAYILEGFQKNWIETGADKRYVTFTNLDPGEYYFKVKASNNDGIWNDKITSLKIIIKPPIWKTKWMIFFFILLAALILYLYNRYIVAREKYNHQIELERVEARQMHEIDMMRFHLFTNISHEFRTPLTLIIGPLEKLLLDNKLDHHTNNYLALMYRNAQRLLRLINQLLDFRKLEAGQLKLEATQDDIVHFIKTIAQSFDYHAAQRNFTYTISSSVDHLQCWFDPDKLDKILYNLISNAFKYTPNSGEVKVNIDLVNTIADENNNTEFISIKVEDNGIGIPNDSIDKIFSVFYQVEGNKPHKSEGTGIGLALTKELVLLHKGKINVESEVGKGSCLTVFIPLGNKHLRKDQLVEANINLDEKVKGIEILVDSMMQKEVVLANSETVDDNSPLLLLVEDNDEMRQFIKSELSASYRILEANDGVPGLAIATEEIPDLVISDIMMKEMDGIELCKNLKTDERTCHIPVILLTAKQSEEHKIEGFETGADDYITKPFSSSLLKARIKNLIDSRQKLLNQRIKDKYLKPAEHAINSVEKDFLLKVQGIIEAHISNKDLSTETLSNELGISQKQLYRKFKAGFNMTANDFIRSLRMSKASDMLLSSSLSIAEIAFSVGYTEPSNFSRSFNNHFGVYPSAYIEAHKNNRAAQ